jgi:hypothetical protein
MPDVRRRLKEGSQIVRQKRDPMWTYVLCADRKRHGNARALYLAASADVKFSVEFDDCCADSAAGRRPNHLDDPLIRISTAWVRENEFTDGTAWVDSRTFPL